MAPDELDLGSRWDIVVIACLVGILAFCAGAMYGRNTPQDKLAFADGVAYGRKQQETEMVDTLFQAATKGGQIQALDGGGIKVIIPEEPPQRATVAETVCHVCHKSGNI